MVGAKMKGNFELPIGKFAEHLGKLTKDQLPYSMSLAQNALMFGAQRMLKNTVDRFVIGGAVPFTKTGIMVHKSSKKELYAAIYSPMSGKNARPYIKTMIQGGIRRPLKDNKKLIVPAYGKDRKSVQRLNKRGNIPRNTVGSIMSRSGQNSIGPVKRESNQYKRKSSKPRTHFIGRPRGGKHRPFGLYKTFRNKGPRLLIAMQETQKTYKSIWPAPELSVKYFDRHFNRIIGEASAEAIRTSIPRVIDSTGF